MTQVVVRVEIAARHEKRGTDWACAWCRNASDGADDRVFDEPPATLFSAPGLRGGKGVGELGSDGIEYGVGNELAIV